MIHRDGFTADYISESLGLAARLYGRRLTHIDRLTRAPLADAPEHSVGDLLLECEGDLRLLIIHEEAQANLMVVDVDPEQFDELQDEMPEWNPILPDAYERAEGGIITSVERGSIRQDPSDYLFGELTGLRLGFADGRSISIGIGLTPADDGVVEVFLPGGPGEGRGWSRRILWEPIARA